MVDDFPAFIHVLIQIGRHDSAVLGGIRVPARNIFRTNHPGHVTGDLDL